MTDAPEKIFEEWFVRNYPGPDTIIGNPHWHAPKIFRAAMYANKDNERAAYLRGLKDAAQVAEREALTARKYPEEAVCETYCTDIADTIRALAKEGGE